MELKDIQGKWVAYSRFSGSDKGLVIEGNKITFAARDPRTDETGMVTAGFELKDNEFLLRGTDCHDIVVEDGTYMVPEYVYHLEKIGDKEVPHISLMTFEYDGRGLIVWTSYVREQDRGLVNEDYESRLYQALNRRPAPPMQMVNGGNPFVKMAEGIGMMGMNKDWDMHRATGKLDPFDIRAADAAPAAGNGEPWDCVCGEKGITSKFCPNCGSNKPQ